MLNTIIKDKIIDNPWPVYIDGELYDGEKIKVYAECDDDCRVVSLSGIDVCEHGLSHISRKISGQLVIVSGVFIPSNISSKRYKKNAVYMKRKVTQASILEWFSNLDEKTTLISTLVNKEAKKNFDQFHEFVKWAGEIKKYSEKVLNKSAPIGVNAFEHASEDLKSLCKTSTMLLDSLDTAALYFNPDSASFGRPKNTDIYSMVHKLKLILSHQSTGQGRVKIEIRGRVENKHNVYESFKIIPLSLIQNAIKYKRTGDIDIIFDENDKKLKMSVVSIGHEIPKHEIDNLFIRGFRTEKAKKMRVDGSGLGLYVLKIVADAHDFNIDITSTPIPPINKGLARNVFTVWIS